MSKGKTAAAIVAFILVACVGWYIASPWWTLRQIRAAALSRDADALEARVDFPSLRASLKEEFQAQILAGSSKDGGSPNPFMVAMMPVMLNRMADAYVTPAALRAMLLKKQSDAEQAGRGPQGAAKDDVEIDRHGLDRFNVIYSKDGGAFVFSRHGLGWKLSGVRLPADVSKAFAKPDR